MPLFEVVILEKPTKKDAEDGAVERLVFGPKAIISRDEQSAAITAVMDNTGGEIKVDRQRMEVIVRPFAE